MRYHDPATGRFISEAEWLALQDEPPEFDWADDEYDWDFDLDPDEYER